jgi:hypothetical protein
VRPAADVVQFGELAVSAMTVGVPPFSASVSDCVAGDTYCGRRLVALADVLDGITILTFTFVEAEATEPLPGDAGPLGAPTSGGTTPDVVARPPPEHPVTTLRNTTHDKRATPAENGKRNICTA